jgi:hypothetical protein
VTFSLVYVSRAAPSMTSQDLLDLGAASQTANDAAGITGLLLYSDGGFLQMLEGPRAAVESLYASIEHDTRHDEVTLVRAREQRDREFPGWSMAFGSVDGKPAEILTGPKDPSPSATEAAFVRDLLAVFDPQESTAHPDGPRRA